MSQKETGVDLNARAVGSQAAVDSSMVTFTIFIPTYNRAYTLDRALQSVSDQTFRDFEVLIIDDGSRDNTRQLVENWQGREIFTIRYYWQKNQGKHVAHNNAVKRALGYFFVLLDSDDMLHPRALERLKYHWESIPDSKKNHFAGVEGLCVYSDSSVQVDRFPEDVMDADYLEKTKKYNIRSEKRNAIRTDVLRQFLYPQFDGERHMRDDLIWKRMARHFKFRYVNEVIQIMEHQTDGLTANIFAMRMRNPRGFRYYFLEEINDFSALTGSYLRFKYHSKFVRYSLHCGVGFREQYREVRTKAMWLLSLPRGTIGWLKDKVKMAIRPVN
jgi:glycosyltransferase involved in cell wall biosynthesis